MRGKTQYYMGCALLATGIGIMAYLPEISTYVASKIAQFENHVTEQTVQESQLETYIKHPQILRHNQ